MTVPVIVGAAAVTQHSTDPESSLDAAGLMIEACRRAADASGAPDLAARAGLIAVPRGTWRYPDAGRLVARALGADGARTLSAELGVLQTTVLSTAVDAVAEGTCDVAFVVGGEALDRRRVARGLGRRAPETSQSPDAVPDVLLAPSVEFRGEHETEWGIEEPFVQYALIDSARRHRLGLDLEGNRRQVAQLWAGFSEVAAANPDAWVRQRWSVDDLLDAGRRGNRMLAFPYSAKLVTQMHVDQAAAVLICSVEVAQRAGVPRERWVFPVLTADCEVSVPLAERTAVGECPQWGLVAEEVEAALGAPLATVDHIDLYSCFPIAVALQRDAFGLRDRATLTVTGGMTFGGGPLNNAALQAVARSVELLQRDPGSALVTAVSGLLTKQGALLLTSAEPDRPHRRIDLTERARPLVGRREVIARHTGRAVVEAATAVVPRDGRPEAVLLLRTSDGLGTVARSTDADVVADVMGDGSLVGRAGDVIEGVLDGLPLESHDGDRRGAVRS